MYSNSSLTREIISIVTTPPASSLVPRPLWPGNGTHPTELSRGAVGKCSTAPESGIDLHSYIRDRRGQRWPGNEARREGVIIVVQKSKTIWANADSGTSFCSQQHVHFNHSIPTTS